ncbi:hypothetical protein CLOM_g20502 [Closterium sp. NIES-68]|nr:hypothetical protein CLOM_g20502 [Closterium sp. NIES-68]
MAPIAAPATLAHPPAFSPAVAPAPPLAGASERATNGGDYGDGGVAGLGEADHAEREDQDMGYGAAFSKGGERTDDVEVEATLEELEQSIADLEKTINEDRTRSAGDLDAAEAELEQRENDLFGRLTGPEAPAIPQGPGSAGGSGGTGRAVPPASALAFAGAPAAPGAAAAATAAAGTAGAGTAGAGTAGAGTAGAVSSTPPSLPPSSAAAPAAAAAATAGAATTAAAAPAMPGTAAAKAGEEPLPSSLLAASSASLTAAAAAGAPLPPPTTIPSLASLLKDADFKSFGAGSGEKTPGCCALREEEDRPGRCTDGWGKAGRWLLRLVLGPQTPGCCCCSATEGLVMGSKDTGKEGGDAGCRESDWRREG